MHIANFTPDEIEWVHGGLHSIIKPGKVIEVDTSRGNHILNTHGPRGLLQLAYGDDEVEAKKLAKGIYTRFWERQIMMFNQHNERMRNEQKAYIAPTREIVEHAKSLGFELLGPWAMRQTDSKEVAELQTENRKLHSEIGELKDAVDTMIQKFTQEIEFKVTEKDKYLRQFKTKSKPAYAPWVKGHIEEIRTWPIAVQEEAKYKWVDFYPAEPWPLNAVPDNQ